MDFWGVEVKAGKPLKVSPGDDKMIHLSQASLGESKEKANDSVPLFVNINDQRLVLGTLTPQNCPQISFDLVFEKEFELSHNWKNGSVYFCGYKADVPHEHEFSDSDYDSEEDEMLDLPINNAANGKLEPEVGQEKPAKSNAAKPKVKLVEPPKEDKKSENDEEDSDEDESFGDSSDDDEELPSAEDDSSDDDDNDEESSDDEAEATPKKAASAQKRPMDSATKTPVPAKKTKLATPQKTDGKKGGHTATPHPSKQPVKKTPASGGDKSKAQTPKSAGGDVSCSSCSKTFKSEGALQSHTKAKHK